MKKKTDFNIIMGAMLIIFGLVSTAYGIIILILNIVFIQIGIVMYVKDVFFDIIFILLGLLLIRAKKNSNFRNSRIEDLIT